MLTSQEYVEPEQMRGQARIGIRLAGYPELRLKDGAVSPIAVASKLETWKTS
jgi:hypothetical protein